jgi:hypothetical protein
VVLVVLTVPAVLVVLTVPAVLDVLTVPAVLDVLTAPVVPDVLTAPVVPDVLTAPVVPVDRNGLAARVGRLGLARRRRVPAVETGAATTSVSGLARGSRRAAIARRVTFLPRTKATTAAWCVRTTRIRPFPIR